MHRSATVAIALAIAAPLAVAEAQDADPATFPYRDPSLGVEARAADLVARMTLEEKAGQLGHTAPAIPRLGVPEYNWWNEGLHGVARAGHATVFPQVVGMAATWDAPLMHEVADVISTEFRAKYVDTLMPDGGSAWYRGLTVWSPNINIFRDPRWGRGQETYGEDPYLTGQMAIAFIQGLQGDDPNYLKTVATAKHYAVHSGPESNRHREDVHPSPHDLEDTYLPAFRAAIVDGGAQSVMCAYNAVDGVPACASADLMETRLRGDWGFSGYVVSDCGAAANIFREDALHYIDSPAAGVAAGFEAGMDVICGDYRNNMSTEPEHIVAAVRVGLLDEAVLDRVLTRLFSARIRLGMFDPAENVPYASITAADYDTEAHNALARRMAAAAMVLLKNDGLLPLAEEPQTIAVVGPNADSYDALVGNYNGIPSHPVTVLDGIRARFPDAEVVFAPGSGLVGPAEPNVPDAALCVDMACSAPGLVAEHYATLDLSGAPTATGVEPNAQLSWAGSDRRATSSVWSGTILASETGEHRLRVISRGGYRIWIDGELIADTWDEYDASMIAGGTVALEAGRRYPIRVAVKQVGTRGDQRLVWTPPTDGGAEAVAAAEAADLVVFVAGLSARVEGEEMRVEAPGFSGGDRTSLDLPAPQEELLERVHATGTPVVLVLMSGSALGVNWADEHVPAIIEAWYPGGSGGAAVAGLIAGDFSPAGRLPVTFYKSVDQLPAFDDYAMAGRTYRYFEGEPLYPFGYGLSYTTFEYGRPRLSARRVAAGEPLTVSVDVTNTGDRDGDEVVELYLSHLRMPGAPVRSLARFARVSLAAGGTQTVTFTLDDRALSTVGADGVRRVAPGRVNLWIGGGQPVERDGLEKPAGRGASFRVTSGAVLER